MKKKNLVNAVEVWFGTKVEYFIFIFIRMKSQDNNGLSRQDVHRFIPKSQYEPKHCIGKIEYFVRTT